MRKPLTLKNIFKKEPTRSILFLLIEFGDKTKGLRPLHFRYALEKGYPSSERIKEDMELNHNVRWMKNFFGNKLEHLHNSHYIVKDCINSKEHLNYYLRILGKNHLYIIEKKGKGKKSRYQIRADFYREGIRLQNNYVLGSFSQDKIKKFSLRIELVNEKNKGRNLNHVIYGLSEEMYKKFSNANRKIVEKNLFDIEKKINEIEEIKKKILWHETIIRLEKFFCSTKSSKIKKVLQEKPLEFFLMFIEAYKDQKGSSNSKLRFWNNFNWLFAVSEDEASKAMGNDEHMKKLCKWFNEKYFDMGHRLSWEDIREMLEWGWKNMDLYDFVFPMSIAFSRYIGYENYFKTDTMDISVFNGKF